MKWMKGMFLLLAANILIKDARAEACSRLRKTGVASARPPCALRSAAGHGRARVRRRSRRARALARPATFVRELQRTGVQQRGALERSGTERRDLKLATHPRSHLGLRFATNE